MPAQLLAGGTVTPNAVRSYAGFASIGEIDREAIMPTNHAVTRLALELDTSAATQQLRDLEGMSAKIIPGRGCEVISAHDPDQTFLDGAGI